MPETPPRRNSNSVATEVCSIRVHPEPFPSQPTPPCSIATKNCPAKSVFDCSTQEYLRYFVRGDLRLIHIAALFDRSWIGHVKLCDTLCGKVFVSRYDYFMDWIARSFLVR